MSAGGGRLSRGLLLAALGAAAGCSGFLEPTPESLAQLQLPPVRPPGDVRVRVRMDVDSPWLAGSFEGVVLARRGPSPKVRAQFFPDLGPKALDLTAAPGRIVGYFPVQKEGVDCALPGESTVHPITLIGATLLEHFADLTPARIEGMKAEAGVWLLQVPSLLPGCSTVLRYVPGKGVTGRRFRWHYGVTWDQEYRSPRECLVSASSVRVRISILEEKDATALAPALLELTLPEAVRLTAGTRK